MLTNDEIDLAITEGKEEWKRVSEKFWNTDGAPAPEIECQVCHGTEFWKNPNGEPTCQHCHPDPNNPKPWSCTTTEGHPSRAVNINYDSSSRRNVLKWRAMER